MTGMPPRLVDAAVATEGNRSELLRWQDDQLRAITDAEAAWAQRRERDEREAPLPRLGATGASSAAPAGAVPLPRVRELEREVASLETLLRGSQQENVRLLDQFKVERQRHVDAEAQLISKAQGLGRNEELKFEVDRLRKDKRDLQFQARHHAAC